MLSLNYGNSSEFTFPCTLYVCRLLLSFVSSLYTPLSLPPSPTHSNQVIKLMKKSFILKDKIFKIFDIFQNPLKSACGDAGAYVSEMVVRKLSY